MARKPTQQQVIDDLLNRYDPIIAQAFRQAVEDVRGSADLQRLIAALAAGDLNAALNALHLEAAAYGPLAEAIRQAYGDAGTASAALANDQTPAGVVIRFNIRNPRAETWLRDHSSQAVTRIIEDQRNAIRAALQAGMERGVNPRTAALDIVGRVNRATGKREGGIIGLTSTQEAAARAARDELASGDAALLRNYLTRERRDRRFDRSVASAIREGRPVPAAIVASATDRYRARLLELRGSTIARTEALASLHAARQEAYLQAVEDGKVAEADIRRVWQSAGDSRVRHTHAILHGKSAGLREPFRSASGAMLMFPGDPSAPPSETINCRCGIRYDVDFLAGIR